MSKDIWGLLALIAEELRGDGHTLDVGTANACDCGCGTPAGIVFAIDGRRVLITSPDVADGLIDGLISLREGLWGPRHGATDHRPRTTVHDGKGVADVRRN